MSTENEQFLARMLLKLNEAIEQNVTYYGCDHPIRGKDLERLQDIEDPGRLVVVDCEECEGEGSFYDETCQDDVECGACEGDGAFEVPRRELKD